MLKKASNTIVAISKLYIPSETMLQSTSQVSDTNDAVESTATNGFDESIEIGDSETLGDDLTMEESASHLDEEGNDDECDCEEQEDDDSV